jgi:hypothetical protein
VKEAVLDAAPAARRRRATFTKNLFVRGPRPHAAHLDTVVVAWFDGRAMRRDLRALLQATIALADKGRLPPRRRRLS